MARIRPNRRYFLDALFEGFNQNIVVRIGLGEAFDLIDGRRQDKAGWCDAPCGTGAGLDNGLIEPGGQLSEPREVGSDVPRVSSWMDLRQEAYQRTWKSGAALVEQVRVTTEPLGSDDGVELPFEDAC